MKIHFKYLILLLCSAASFCASSAIAKDADNDKIIIVTAMGVEQNAEDSGVSVSVIENAEILEQQAISVASLLQELPGVNVTQSGGFGGQTSVRIRGAESDQTLVLINGIRVNDPSTPDGSFDFANMLTGNIDRVEVLRGANSVAWGSQAIGGVVHVTTRRPRDDFEVFAQGEYGANDTIRLVSNASGKLGPVGLSLGGGYIRTDGVSAFSGGTERDGFRQYSANGRVDIEIADNIRFEASGYYTDSRADNDSVFPPFSSESTQFSLAEEFYGNVSISADAFDGRFKNRFAYSIADINRDIISPFFSSLPRGRTERFEYRGDFEVYNALRFVFGTEVENSRYENSGVADNTGIDSIFVQAIGKPLDDLSLTIGIRHDEHDDFGGNTSLAGNFAYIISENGPTIRASYAEGFRAPSLIDLDDRVSGFGTPSLRPERAKSFEVGFDQPLLSDAVQISATLFHRDIEDQITFAACPLAPDPAPAVCLSGNRPFGTTLNIEQSRTTGVEAAMVIQPTDRFTVEANYTYLDTENRSSGPNFGNKLARRPSNSFYVNARYETGVGLILGADLRIVGDSFDDLANSRRIDGHAVAGVRASMPVTDNFEIFGRIDNLFDVTYETATDFGTLGRSAYIGARARF